jgi:nonsense-mediated mRNA decay protein 3
MDIICPKCGARSSQKEFVGAFCVDCVEFNLKLPKPSALPVSKCKRCGMMFLKGEWQPYSEERICEAVEKKCRGEFESVSYDLGRGILTFRAKAGGKEVTIERPFPLDIGISMCPDCSRRSGGYFEAIIQLRGGNPERLKQYSEALQKRLSKKTFISKVDELKEGIDLYIGSSKAALGEFRDRGIKCTISTKLFGESEGKRIYRTTFLVRL